MKLIIVCGVSGSGKSTWAKANMPPNSVRMEADLFFYENGQYCFNPNMLSAAHRWCRVQTEMYLGLGMNVVVSNTFSRKWEVQPYLDMVKLFPGCELIIHHCDGDYKSIHAPDDAVLRQKANDDSWWKEYV